MTTPDTKRKLAAILSADVKGYSRLMSLDEEATVKTLKQHRLTVSGLVGEHRGRVVDSPGDNILAEFGSVVDAVNCAVESHRDLAERNTELPENRWHRPAEKESTPQMWSPQFPLCSSGYTLQLASFNPSIRAKCRVLLVTRTRFRERAVAAMMRSKSSKGLPFF